MGKTPCFVCKKNLGWTSVGYSLVNYEKAKISPIPSGLTNDDKVCNLCWDNAVNQQINQKEELKLLRKNQNKNQFI